MSLYGLKQAPRAWYQKLTTFLFSIGFIGSRVDSSLFHYTKDTNQCFLLVYVDDVIIIGNNSVQIQHLINSLATAFALRNLSTLHYFLSIQV